jgi:hypothetical protein
MRRFSALTVLRSALILVLAAGPAFADDTPKIRSVTPTSAFRAGTADVTIEGLNLLPYDELISNRPEISFVVLPVPTAYKIVLRLTLPDACSPGPVEFSIKTKTGVVKTDKFSVKLRSPIITRTTPSAIVRGGEADVKLDGTNLAFMGQDSIVTVDSPMTAKLAGKPAGKGAATSLTVHLVVPFSTPVGSHSLTIETTDGKATTVLNVALAPPVVTQVTPLAIARGAEADLSTAGKNLAGSAPIALAIPDAAVTVTAKGAPTLGLIPVHIAVRADAAPGPRMLIVQTPDGTAGAKFEVTTTAPRLTALKPAGAARGTEVHLVPTVDGGATGYVLRVMPADPAITLTPEPSGSWKLAAAADAQPGSRTIVLDHPFGASAVTFAVNVRAPSLAGLSPAELAPGTESDVLLEGQQLEGATSALAVEDPSVVIRPGPSSGVIHVTVAATAKPGPRPVVVRTADGAAVATLTIAGVTTSAPVLSPGTPGRIPRGHATEVLFTGVNLRSAGDTPPIVTASMAAGPVPVTIVASTSTALRVRLEPPATAEMGGCVVAAVTSEGVVAGAVTVVAAGPALAIVTPSRLVRPGDAQIVIGGTDLVCPGGFAPTVALVRADGSASFPARVDSATADKVVATLPLTDAATPGSWVLVVSTSEGGAAMVLPVDAMVPSIDGLEPAMIGTPAIVTFVVHGRNLVGPGGKPPALTVTRVGSASNLRAELLDAKPDALSVRIATPVGSPAGAHLLVLKTADGSTAGLFEVVDAPMPTITSIEPAVGTRLETSTVMLKGKGLLGTTTIAFSGKGVTAVIQPGANDSLIPLRVSVAGDAEAGVRQVTVTSPGGQATNPKVTFTVK